ncbi:hypothetical protein BRC91_03285 [Halobacteriales archaeon QS_4_62_28]|nr:MAG: hypothetical protein BRC91_03285 [Halobacteriales archaeon QS_4_62_28]
MTLRIALALRNGVGNLTSRTGMQLLVTYTTAFVLFQAAYNGLMARPYERMTVYGTRDIRAMQPAMIEATWLQVVVLILSVFAMGYLSVVAIRTFAARARRSFPADATSRKMTRAVHDFFVGGVACAVLSTVGLAAFVVPGLFAMVSFVFVVVHVADQSEGLATAFRRSWRLASGNRLRISTLLLAVGLIGTATLVVSAVGGALLVGANGPLGAISLGLAVVTGPISLYGLAVLTDAYTQLRDSEVEISDGQSTTADAPSATV